MRAAFDAGLKDIAPGSEAAKAYEGSIDWIDSQSGGSTEVTAVPANDFVERISGADASELARYGVGFAAGMARSVQGIGGALHPLASRHVCARP